MPIDLNDNIDEVYATIDRLSDQVDDAAAENNAELWDDLSTELEDAEEEVSRLVAIRDA